MPFLISKNNYFEDTSHKDSTILLYISSEDSGRTSNSFKKVLRTFLSLCFTFFALCLSTNPCSSFGVVEDLSVYLFIFYFFADFWIYFVSTWPSAHPRHAK